ncbi:MAG TPA: TonB-dependent receptor [Rhodanobacteraceae bacterium]|nr:TonB-dependent receptor [Rhodanobacteraceae bacterium]
MEQYKCIGILLAFALLCGSADATAQDAVADSESKQQSALQGQPKTLDTVVVTGTHIRGVDLETEHPVLTLDRQAIQRTGLSGVAEVVQSLVVANGQSLNRNINNGTNGELRVNLRSLGSNRTLVLVNGRRWASAVDGAVDLSAIPLALVERIDVLKDGASAIYGSDAIGGVVNIITRQRFTGTELGLYAGETDHGDGRSRHADFGFGRSGDKWNVAFGLDWGDEDPVMASARTISSVPRVGLPLGATGSAASQYGVFGVPGIGGAVLIKGRQGTSPDDFRSLDPATDLNYNFVPYNYLRTPQQRRAGFGQFRWEFSPTLAFSADALFNQRRSAQQLAPPTVFISSRLLPGTTQAFDVAADNVYNPFGVPVFAVNTRWPDDEPRRFEQSVDTARFHLGLDGLVDFLGRDWVWNLDATRTRAAKSEFAGPYADNEKLQLAVGPSFRDADGVARCGTPDDVIEGCVPLDVFTGPGRFTQAMLDYVNVDIQNHTRASTDELDFNATTTLADLPAGALAFAAGLERRLERGEDDPDPLIESGRANGTGVTYGPTEGAYAINEAYLEFDIPLLSGKPLVHALDVNLATRWSDYSLFGGTNNSRVGLRWKPVENLLFRSTWAQGFRAPSILDLFGGPIVGPAGLFDPCVEEQGYSPPAAVAAHCLADGVPPDAPPPTATFETSGSNRDLVPETSRSLTAGLVYSPAWWPGFDASLDWYRIRIHNAIGNPGGQYFVDACYVDNDPAACTHITRASGGESTGELLHVDSTMQNLPGGLETEGWDFGLSWKRTTRFGSLDLRWDSAYVSYWGAIGQPARGTPLPDGSLASGNVAGKSDPLYGVIWRLRSVATLAWQRGVWGASITGRYFSPIVEDCRVVTQVAGFVGDPSLESLCSDPNHVEDGIPAPRNRVGAVTYVDLETSWNAPWQARLAFGIRNAFDRDPPVAYSVVANSFFPDYDIPGRFFYLAYRQRF